MGRRIWLVLGVLAGVGIALGKVSYLAGAAHSWADDAQRLVASGGHHLVSTVASSGAPKRVVEGLTGLVSLLLPGVTALALVVAAKGTLRLRAVVAVLVTALSAAAFAYQARGHALGVLFLALAVAALAVTLTGPLVAAPLCALAGLIGGEYLPRLLAHHSTIPDGPVQQLHLAIYGQPGTPSGLKLAVLVLACVPFAFGARSVLRP